MVYENSIGYIREIKHMFDDVNIIEATKVGDFLYNESAQLLEVHLENSIFDSYMIYLGNCGRIKINYILSVTGEDNINYVL